MVVLKRSTILNAFVLMHATSASAKGVRSTDRKMLVGKARFYNGKVPSEAPSEAWEEFSLQQVEMSMPSTSPPPTPAPTPPPTMPPTPPPTTAAVTPTAAPLPALFLDEDDEFEEFGLVECQGGKF